MTKTAKLSLGERTLLIAVSILAVLLLGILYWRYTLEINPVISTPAPLLSHLNTLEYYLKASEILGDLQMTVGERHCTYGIADLESLYRSSANGQPYTSLPTTTNQPAPTWEMAEMYVKRFAPAFAILHQGFTIDYHEIRSGSGEKPLPLPQFRKSTRALVLAGRVNAHHGDWAGATDRYLDAVQLGEDIQHGGNITAFLSGRLYQDIGRTGAWAAIPHLNGTQARAAAQRMETLIARTPSYVNMLQSEKYSTLAWMNACFHKPGWRREVLRLDPHRYSYFDTLRFDAYSKRYVMRHFIHLMDRIIANAEQPYSARSAPLSYSDNPLDQIGPLIIINPRCRLTTNDTQNALLLTSYALQAFYAEHGRYPDKLGELAPAYVKVIPNDPFASNKPLCYKRTGIHYLLYSIGPNGIDNGGTASSDGQENAKLQKGIPMIEQQSSGDIVAGVNVR